MPTDARHPLAVVPGAAMPARGAASAGAVWAGACACTGYAAYVALLLATMYLPGRAGGLGFKGQMAGCAVFLVCTLPFAGRALGWLAEGNRRSTLVFHAFWLALLLLVPFGGLPFLSLIYLCLTFGIYAMMGLVWMAPRRHRQVMAAVVVAGCLGMCGHLVLTQPIIAGHLVGGVHPNSGGGVAVTAVLLSFLLPGPWRWAVYGAAVALTVALTTRGSLLVVLLFVAIFESLRILIDRRWHRAAWLAAGVCLLGLAAAAAGLLRPELGRRAFDVVDRALLITSPARGLNSGLSGRTDRWEQFSADLEGHMIAGVGFRTSRAGMGSTHNGHFDLVREVGVPAAFLFYLFIGLRLVQYGRSLCWSRLSLEDRREHAGLFAALVAMLVMGAFERTMVLNIGFPGGALALLLYARHEPRPEEAA